MANVRPFLTVGVPVYEDSTGLWATLLNLRKAICKHRLHDQVELVVVDNQPRYAPNWMKRQVETKSEGRYVPLAAPTGTGAPRNRIFDEARGRFTLVMDAHVELYDTDQLPAMLRYLMQYGDDSLYFGPCLSDSVMNRQGQLNYVWTHWKPTFGRDGLFGVAQISREILSKATPTEIQHSGAGLFAAETASFLRFHPEQIGFGAEGWLQLSYVLRGRKVLCVPDWRWNHWFRPKGEIKTTYNSGWRARAGNYLLYVRDLPPNPYMTYAAVRAAHVRADRVSLQQWGRLLAERNMVERDMQARDATVAAGLATNTLGAVLLQVLHEAGAVTAETPADAAVTTYLWTLDSVPTDELRRQFVEDRDTILAPLRAAALRCGWQARLSARALATAKNPLPFRLSWADPLADALSEALRRL